VRSISLKLATLAVGFVALVLSATPRANATTISATDGGNTFSIDYTLSGGVLTITDFTLNGVTNSGKIFVVAVDQASLATITDNTGLFTKTTNSNNGPFHPITGVENTGGNGESFPLGTFTIGGTPTDLIFHLGGFPNTSCSIWIEGPAGGGSGTAKGLDQCGGTSTVPEPGTLGLLGTGLVGIAGLIRRRFVS